jgi:hypothetical protein
MDTDLRATHLCWIAILGMGCLGGIAIVTEVGGHIFGSQIFGVLIAAFIGCLVGFPSIPIMVICLMKKRLVVSLPFVYGPSAAAIIWHAMVYNEMNDFPAAALLALSSVCGLSVIAFFVLPNAPQLKLGRCAQCGYDLRGSRISAVCPECGTPIAPRATPPNVE